MSFRDNFESEDLKLTSLGLQRMSGLGEAVPFHVPHAEAVEGDGTPRIVKTEWRVFADDRIVEKINVIMGPDSRQDAPHNHPSVLSVSTILRGWYVEDRYSVGDDGVLLSDLGIRRSPGDEIMMDHDVFHVIREVCPEGVISYFRFLGDSDLHACGKPDWGYLDLGTLEYRSAHDGDNSAYLKKVKQVNGC